MDNVGTPHPHWYQPLSHGATRRDSSPFRGAEGRVEACGVCASAYRDADTYVSRPPVRGGVLDAPRSRDRRAALDAAVRHDQPHPRSPRCVRLASTAQRFISRGHSPRTISHGSPTLSVDRGRAGVEDKPLRRVGMFRRRTGVVLRPKAGRRGRRPLRAVCIFHVAAYNIRAQPAHHYRRIASACFQNTPLMSMGPRGTFAQSKASTSSAARTGSGRSVRPQR